MSVYWCVVALGLVGSVCFAFGFIVRHEVDVWKRSREPYVREFDLTHTSRRV